MDARGVQRLLEKPFGMADTALTAGAKSAEVMVRDARLSDPLKAQLIPLYAEESVRRTLNYAGLGLAICRVIEPEMTDEAAKNQLEWYRTRLNSIYETARAAFDRDFDKSRALEPG